jgi:hypothetical protein
MRVVLTTVFLLAAAGLVDAIWFGVGSGAQQRIGDGNTGFA